MNTTALADRYPMGSRVRLADLYIDPYPILHRLRREEPVTWVEEVGMWFVTRRADVLSILRDAVGFANASRDSTVS